MKKICFFSGDITRSGGTERVSIMIANELAKQQKDQILFLSLVEQEKQLFFKMDSSIKHYALGKKWLNPGPGYLAVLPKLYRFLKREQIDVLIDIDIVLDVLSLPVSRFLKTKVISWGHFSYYFEQSSLYRKWILKYSVRCADYMVTINEENKKCYQQFLGRTKRIQTIYNPVEEVACNTIDSKEKWLISVGRLVPIKGIDYLAKVAVSVLRKNKDWKWLVIGDGEERTRLEKVISKYHLQDQLILKGRVDNVGEYLQKAQIFVLTSRSEGLPMCLLEAKMCGLPSVSFDIQTGPREIIKDGVNGYLVKPYDCVEMVNKISTLIQSEELRKDFAKNTKQDLEKFQMKQIIERWNGVLENLCD